VAGEEDFFIAPGDLRLVGHVDQDKCLTPICTDERRFQENNATTDAHG
jgi:hypothetical protein